MKILSFFAITIFGVGVCLTSVTAQNNSNITPPKPLSIPKPEKIKAAEDAGIDGQVFIEVLVDKRGKVSVKDVFGPNIPCSDLDDPLAIAVRNSAVEAAKKATFETALLRGKPIDMGFRIVYDFDSKDITSNGDNGNSPTVVKGGVVNGKVISIPRAKYPDTSDFVAGSVKVRVLISEAGRVQSVGILSGHPTLRREVMKVVCGARFQPTLFDGKPVKVNGILLYDFSWKIS